MLSLEKVQAARCLQNLRKPELSGHTVFRISAGTRCFIGLKGARNLGVLFTWADGQEEPALHHLSLPRKLPTKHPLRL